MSLRIFPAGFASIRLPGPYDAAEEAVLEHLVVSAVRPLTGTVVDQAGVPVAGARVTVAGADAMLGEESLLKAGAPSLRCR